VPEGKTVYYLYITEELGKQFMQKNSEDPLEQQSIQVQNTSPIYPNISKSKFLPRLGTGKQSFIKVNKEL
jgi:hypothetical protein